MGRWSAELDGARERLGYLRIEALMALRADGNLILDPYSTLVSVRAVIGSGNVLMPGITLTCAPGAELVIGDGNMLHQGTLIAVDTGAVRIGAGNLLGEAGLTIRANRADALIEIGDHGRYQSGVTLIGRCKLGSGSQILGPIAVDSCELGAGGSFREPDPDLRGGVLKGFGVARGLRVPQGQVIQGHGVFDAQDIKLQTFFHPKA